MNVSGVVVVVVDVLLVEGVDEVEEVEVVEVEEMVEEEEEEEMARGEEEKSRSGTLHTGPGLRAGAAAEGVDRCFVSPA